MEGIRIACEACNGSGEVEARDPERMEKCRHCGGTGVDSSLARLVDVLRRPTYSDGRAWRVPSSKYLEEVTLYGYRPHRDDDFHIVQRTPSGVISCSCPDFRWRSSKVWMCKHPASILLVRQYQVEDWRYVVPYWEEGSYKEIIISAWPHKSLPAVEYRVRDAGQPNIIIARGLVPAWLWHGDYDLPGTQHRGERWLPQFPVEKELDEVQNALHHQVANEVALLDVGEETRRTVREVK